MDKNKLKEIVSKLNDLSLTYGSDLEVAFALYLRSNVEDIDNLTEEQIEELNDITNGMNNMLEDYYYEVDSILERE